MKLDPIKFIMGMLVIVMCIAAIALTKEKAPDVKIEILRGRDLEI